MTKEEFRELLSAMKGIQHKMEAMKRGLSDEQEATDERLIKKMQLNKGIHFKRKENERHSFNEEVKDKFEFAAKALKATPLAVDMAKGSGGVEGR